MEIDWLRLFLEYHGFSTQWSGEVDNGKKKNSSRGFATLEFFRVSPTDSEPDSPSPQPAPFPSSFYLYARDLDVVQAGTVLVRSWNQWQSKPERLKTGADYYRLIEKNIRKEPDHQQRNSPYLVLLLPGFPVADPWKTRLKEYLTELNIHGVFSLRAILHDLTQRTEWIASQTGSGYTPALDLLRMLRFYDILKDPQLELFS